MTAPVAATPPAADAPADQAGGAVLPGTGGGLAVLLLGAAALPAAVVRRSPPALTRERRVGASWRPVGSGRHISIVVSHGAQDSR